MTKYGKYIIVTDIEELRKNPIWEQKNTIRTEEGVFHLTKKVNFPQCFEYVEPFDFHFCGDYYPCNKAKMVKAIEERIKELTDLKEKVDTI